MLNSNLPIYQLVINNEDESGVDYIALVDQPAIEKNFIAFNNSQKFQIQNEEKRIVSGALMIAGLPIYRYDMQMGEYYCVFLADTIRQIAMKYFKNQYTSNVNLMHDPNQQVQDVFMFESWLVDRSLGKMPMKGFEDVADGSWFGSFKVNNDQVWNEIKQGAYKGFSVEGLFGGRLVPMGERQILSKIDEIKKLLNT